MMAPRFAPCPLVTPASMTHARCRHKRASSPTDSPVIHVPLCACRRGGAERTDSGRHAADSYNSFAPKKDRIPFQV